MKQNADNTGGSSTPWLPGTMHLYLEISLKPAVFSCLTNSIAPPPIALETCSNTQKIRQIF